MRVCIAGTFNTLHRGHKLLIDTAIKTGGENGKLFIGIAKGGLLKNKKFIVPYDERKRRIQNYLLKKNYQCFEILPIYNKYGFAVDGEYDAIVVSPETKDNAQKINEKRIKEQKKPLIIITIPYVLAQDSQPISSTRILKKEIDCNGTIIEKKKK